MQTAVSFGRLLKEYRKTLDLTQENLARQVGCALITIKKIEGDTLRPSKAVAERLAKVLAIPSDEQATFILLARPTPKIDTAPVLLQTPQPQAARQESFDLSGRVVKGYELIEPIGAGGFGVVYRAQQIGIQRDVAI